MLQSVVQAPNLLVFRRAFAEAPSGDPVRTACVVAGGMLQKEPVAEILLLVDLIEMPQPIHGVSVGCLG